jgi:hypothetical protein
LDPFWNDWHIQIFIGAWRGDTRFDTYLILEALRRLKVTIDLPKATIADLSNATPQEGTQEDWLFGTFLLFCVHSTVVSLS